MNLHPQVAPLDSHTSAELALLPPICIYLLSPNWPLIKREDWFATAQTTCQSSTKGYRASATVVTQCDAGNQARYSLVKGMIPAAVLDLPIQNQVEMSKVQSLYITSLKFGYIFLFRRSIEPSHNHNNLHNGFLKFLKKYLEMYLPSMILGKRIK